MTPSKYGLWPASRSLRPQLLGVGLLTACMVLLFQAGLLEGKEIAGSEIFSTLYPSNPFRAGLREAIAEVLINPTLYAGTALILALEYFFPARREQKLFSKGLTQDWIWMFGESFLKFLFLIPTAKFVLHLDNIFLDPFQLSLQEKLHIPHFLSIAISILLVDSLSWFNHILLHKVPLFWRFHAVHHSQKELNLFTHSRGHFAEVFVSYPITFSCMFLLGIPPHYGIYYIFLRTWHARFCHSNVRTNLGILRHIFVSPQYHRLHHSMKDEHIDKNFGTIFSFWDRLFRTNCTSSRDYPRTGIHDEEFPAEQRLNSLAMLQNYFLQLWYPFKIKKSKVINQSVNLH